MSGIWEGRIDTNMTLEKGELLKYIDAPLLTRPEKPLAGNSALITGATRHNGIGAAMAERFALEGVSPLILTGTTKSQDIAPVVKERLEKYGSEVHLLVGDVTDKDSCLEMVQRAYVICGGNVNILINNAGITRDKAFTEVTVEDWDAVVRTKALGAFLMTQAWFQIRNEGSKPLLGGRVIHMGSIIGRYGNFGQEAYAMANSSLVGLTKTQSLALGRWGITVNMIAPGFVEGTDMTSQTTEEEMNGVKAVSALNRLVKTEDVAAAAVYLAGPDGESITGHILTVDCGIQSNYTAARKMHQAGFRQVPRAVLGFFGDLVALPPDMIRNLRDQVRAHRGDN